MPMPAGAQGCIFDTAELGSCENEPYGYIVPKAPLGAQSGYNPGLPHSDFDYVQYLPISRIRKAVSLPEAEQDLWVGANPGDLH